MRQLALGILVAVVTFFGCASSPHAPGGSSVDGGDETGGEGGSGAGIGGGGIGGKGGQGGAVLPDAAVAGSGGSGGSGPAGEGGGEPDAAADAGASSSEDAGGGGAGGAAGGLLGFYEAEAVMPAGPNELIAPAVISNCPNMSPTCGAPEAVKPETPCCFQGKEVRQLLRGKGGLQFNKINAPADGMYDVTWYYHCGKNDNFGDGNCGGEPNHPAGGCRPHVLTINGTRQPKVYEFHCYPGMWGEIHVVTTQLPLKSGDNSIRVVATPGRDAADLDAIGVFPAGKGPQPQAFAH
jgi:hypothetical protein